jgi:uncharacterized membrane protein YgdD (TMEM256/DUF423 family)
MPLPRYKIWLLTGAALGCLSVGLGAFGAHGLESALEKRAASQALSGAEMERQLANWETAARYQMYHALALMAVGFLSLRRCGIAVNVSGASLTLGTALFSGCLYAFVLTQQRWLVHVVPMGGVLLIVGWAALVVAAWRDRPVDAEKHQGTAPP